MSSKEDLNRQIRVLEVDKAALAREYWAAKLGAESLLKTVITQSRQIAALQEQLTKRSWWRRLGAWLRGRWQGLGHWIRRCWERLRFPMRIAVCHCDACQGTGSVRSWRGRTKVKAACSICKGTGHIMEATA